MSYKIISILIGLTPFIQFFLRGWIFLILTLPIYVSIHFYLKRRDYRNYLIYASILVISQIVVYLLGLTSIIIFIYILIVAFLMYIASKDSKRYNFIENYLEEIGENTKEYFFEMCYYGNEQMGNIEDVKNMMSTVIAIGENGVGINFHVNDEFVNRFIRKKNIEDFGLFKFEKNQKPYYFRIRDMFWPRREIINLHKPTLETYGLFIQTKDEMLTFYEEPKIIFKISKVMEKYR